MKPYIASSSIVETIRASDREKPIFLVQQRALQDFGIVVLESSSDKTQWVPCIVDESFYALDDNYKAFLVPTVAGFGSNSFYLLDLASMVRQGQILVLDQSKPWTAQVPANPPHPLVGMLTKLVPPFFRTGPKPA